MRTNLLEGDLYLPTLNEPAQDPIRRCPQYGFALAQLYVGDLAAADEAIRAAQERVYPTNTPAVWAVTGVIRLRQRQAEPAREAFAKAMTEADGLLEKTAQNLSALESKALALSGLALCGDKGHGVAALQAYRAVREITKAAGVMASALKHFDALAEADREGILAPVRKTMADNDL